MACIPLHCGVQVKRLCKDMEAVTDVQQAAGKVTVFGDWHGQFDDLAACLDDLGLPGNEQTYIFNGKPGYASSSSETSTWNALLSSLEA
jgi:hypothetical protein